MRISDWSSDVCSSDLTVYLNGKAIPKKRIGDLVLPDAPNMIEADARENAASPCYRTKFEDKASDGSAICRYPQYRETLPNGKSYNVLAQEDSMADDTNVYVVPVGHLFMMGAYSTEEKT